MISWIRFVVANDLYALVYCLLFILKDSYPYSSQQCCSIRRIIDGRFQYLHTQDIGTIDPHGYLLITDRIKDVIKTGGEWVSSLDVEDLILRVPGVAEVAVVGVPDDKWGERPVALVVVKSGVPAQPTEDAVRKHVAHFADKGTVSKYAVPDRVYFVDAIPKTSVGKLDKKVIRAKLAESQREGAATGAR